VLVDKTGPGRRPVVQTRAPLPSNSNSPSDSCSTSPVAGNPVILATGEKVQSEQDFPDFTAAGLSLTRTYRSNGAYTGMFGPRWGASLDRPTLLVSAEQSCNRGTNCGPSNLKFSLFDGTVKTYNYAGSLTNYRPEGTTSAGTTWGVGSAEGTYYSITVDNRIYRFSKIAPYRLVSIFENGTALYSYSYNPNAYNELSSVVHRSGRSVQFAWSLGRVTTVTDPDGRTWGYGYNSAGQLSQVIPPAGTLGARTYHYESQADTTLLTGISIDNVRSTSYAYDSAGRVQSSGKTNGEAVETFAYVGNTTTVDSAIGQSTVYTFQSVGSFKRLVGVSRSATSTCPQAAAAKVYDANGFLDYELDWKGIKTDYSYNANGQLQSAVFAADTPQAFTETYVWAPGSQLLEKSVRGGNASAFRRYTYTYDGKWMPTTATVTDLRSGQSRSQTLTYAYHTNNELASQTVSINLGGSSATTVLNFNTLGYLTSAVDAAGHTLHFADHNGYGQPRQITDLNGIVTTVTYDARGNVASTATALPTGSRTYSAAYNGWNAPTSVQPSGFGTVGYAYNSAGRLTDRTFAGGTISYGWNVSARTSTTSSGLQTPGFSGSVPYAVSSGTFMFNQVFDSLGRVFR
ncbi:MAG: RHS repeat protein, partial [Nitrospiraceae bacterium]|nr:RHS repeat protein [Nitrospiraceae bacterium]